MDSKARRFPSFPAAHRLISPSTSSAALCKIKSNSWNPSSLNIECKNYLQILKMILSYMSFCLISYCLHITLSFLIQGFGLNLENKWAISIKILRDRLMLSLRWEHSYSIAYSVKHISVHLNIHTLESWCSIWQIFYMKLGEVPHFSDVDVNPKVKEHKFSILTQK